MAFAKYGICNRMRAYICVRISVIKCASSEPPCCFWCGRLVLSIHDNFGDEDGILEDLYGRKGEGHPKQDSHDFSRCQMKVIRFEISGEFKFVVETDFKAYAEQLEFFFVANGVTDPKQKKAVLLSNLPAETYQLAKDLVAPTSLREDSLTYDTIVERLQKQLKPQKSALVARYEFDNRARNAGETVSQYVAVLKHLATECKFNEAMRLERLRDRLVSGIRDKKMMSELLKLKLEELTFDIAVAKCIAIE